MGKYSISQSKGFEIVGTVNGKRRILNGDIAAIVKGIVRSNSQVCRYKNGGIPQSRGSEYE